MANKIVRIGGYSAMWGDVDLPARQLVNQGNCHYLIGDYLAETTMAILAKQRKADPKMGFATGIVNMLRQNAKEIKKNNIKIVCNAGGMNPLGCRDAIQELCAKMKVDLRVGCVLGDEITDRIPSLRQQGVKEMFSGEPIPADAKFTSANAYFGAKPIVAALEKGVDIIVTGRVVDSALVLGICMHEFGWKDDQYDQLCMGTLAGHLLECSAQVTGGLFTDFETNKWENMGYPIAEMSPDGSFVVTKPDNTDGIVCFGTVAEQLVYEIQDPGAYLCPDVSCDFTGVKIEEVGKDRVRVSNGKGLPPTDSYKVCCTLPDDFAAISLMMIVGPNAAKKARKTHAAILHRTRQILEQQKMGDFSEIHIEMLGAHFDPNKDEDDATEVIMKVGLKHKDKRAMGIYNKEGICAGVSMAQGTTGFGATGVSGKTSEVLRVFSLLVPKTDVIPEVVVGSERFQCPVPTKGGFAVSGSASVKPVPAQAPQGELESVQLLKLCYARSGDKGNCCNIGLIARKPEYLPLLRHAVTAERVKKYFSKRVKGDVERYDMPGLNAMNFLCQDALGGGGMATLHSDQLAKTFGQVLLLMKVEVPKAWGLGGSPTQVSKL